MVHTQPASITKIPRSCDVYVETCDK